MKSKRQEKILELIADHSVQTQEQLLAEQRGFADCAAPPDFAEGLAAFFEKRKPRWQS